MSFDVWAKSSEPFSRCARWARARVGPRARGRVGLGLVVLAAAICLPQVAQASEPLIFSAPTLIDPGTIAPVNDLTGVSCTPASLCVAVDGQGNVVTASDPSGSWTPANVDAASLTGVSCTSSACVAVDSGGNVVTATSPTGGASDWTTTAPTVDANGLTGVSCTSSVCVAVDDAGNVVTATNPTGGKAAWTTTATGDTNALTGVSCTSSSCVAVDSAGNVVTATDPTGGMAAWTTTATGDTNGLTGVSCTSAPLCVAVDDAGNVVTATDPTGGAGAWTATNVDGTGLTGVSCPSASLCVAVDDLGQVLISSDPTGGAGSWTTTDPDISGLTGVSCASASLCVAVDQSGNAVIGTPPPPPPVNSSPPTISGIAQTGQVLEEENGTWTNAPTSFAYQWEVCGYLGSGCSVIGGANGRFLEVDSSEVGDTIRVQETASNAGGAGTPVLSAATAVVVAVVSPTKPPSNTACSEGLNASHNRANPLGLATPPGRDPLTGAGLYVEGPGYGLAAGAIAQAVGLNPANLDTMSWPTFESYLAGLNLSPAVAAKVRLLEKIAGEPETAKFTPYNRGGSPPQIYISAHNYICRVPAGQVAVLTTYYLKHQADCRTDLESPADQTLFKQRVNETALALGNHPFVLFSEFDAVGTAGCLTRTGLAERIKLLKYEIATFSKLPHGVIYAEAGESDSNSPKFAAKILNAEGIKKIRGFFLGDTHEAWTIKEIKFGERISKLTHGAHFIVSTQANGHGPLLNPHPSTQGTEDLCNPPRRGLGPRPTASTGFKLVDAFEWVTTPGRSSGTCHPGDPASGIFGVNLALALAANANAKLGPGYPSRPY